MNIFFIAQTRYINNQSVKSCDYRRGKLNDLQISSIIDFINKLLEVASKYKMYQLAYFRVEFITYRSARFLQLLLGRYRIILGFAADFNKAVMVK